MSTNDLVSKAKNIVSRLSSQDTSYFMQEFIMNFNILIQDVQKNDIEGIKKWLNIYDLQALTPFHYQTPVNPAHLPDADSLNFKNEIEEINDFVSLIREKFENG